MVSTESVKLLIAEARGAILVLMQEGDRKKGFESPEWAEEMYRAWELLGSALSTVIQAEYYN